ncbi:MAG: ABC transporter permease subunit, partial [Tumebacillaceae bacterium]
MNLFPLHKGLLWKEWRQNRGVFWLGLIILSFPVIGFTLLNLCDDHLHPMSAGYEVLLSKGLIDFEYNIFFTFTAIGVVGIGVFLLAQERTFVNTLDFLVATPVSRREILNAKFVTGLKMIVILLGVNLAFVLVMTLLFGSDDSIWWIVRYFLEQAVFLT